MAESGDNPRDDLTIAMATNQYVRTIPSIPNRDHELLGMPKGQDDMATLMIETIDSLMSNRLELHRSGKAADQQGSHRRQHRKLQPIQNR